MKLGIFGANGRMGRALIEAISQQQGLELAAAVVRDGSPLIGTDAGLLAGVGEMQVCLTSEIQQDYALADIWIDFTLPEALDAHLGYCQQAGRPMVIGITGLSAEQEASIDDAAAHIPIVFAANMSVGVNLLLGLLQLTASVVGDDWDIEINEAHHRFKKDAPSGTAVAMGKAICDTLNWDFDAQTDLARGPDSGERQSKTIGFSTIRAGDITGEHTAIFADLGERIEIGHKASSRLTFAKGAVRAAFWLHQNWTKTKQAKKFSMQDVLGLGNLV